MKLRAGKDTFKMPPFGMIDCAAWIILHSHMIIRMQQIDQQRMDELRRENRGVRGIPVSYSIAIDGVGYVWPAPDKDGEIRVRYYPPAVEI